MAVVKITKGNILIQPRLTEAKRSPYIRVRHLAPALCFRPRLPWLLGRRVYRERQKGAAASQHFCALDICANKGRYSATNWIDPSRRIGTEQPLQPFLIFRVFFSRQFPDTLFPHLWLQRRSDFCNLEASAANSRFCLRGLQVCSHDGWRSSCQSFSQTDWLFQSRASPVRIQPANRSRSGGPAAAFGGPPRRCPGPLASSTGKVFRCRFHCFAKAMTTVAQQATASVGGTLVAFSPLRLTGVWKAGEGSARRRVAQFSRSWSASHAAPSRAAVVRQPKRQNGNAVTQSCAHASCSWYYFFFSRNVKPCAVLQGRCFTFFPFSCLVSLSLSFTLKEMNHFVFISN